MNDYQFMDMLHAMELFVENCKKSTCENCEQKEQCSVAVQRGFAIPCYWEQQCSEEGFVNDERVHS